MSLRGDSAICPTCQCLLGSSDCCSFESRGPNDPWTPEFILDPATTQLAECGEQGFGVFAPTWLLDSPACCVSAISSQPFGWEENQILLLDKEIYDTDNMHGSELAQLGRITFNTSGVYFVSFNMSWTPTGSDVVTGDVAAMLWKNSQEIIALDSFPIGDSDQYYSHSVTYEGFFDSGEYVEAMGKHDVIDPDNDNQGIIMQTAARTYPPRFAASFQRPAP